MFAGPPREQVTARHLAGAPHPAPMPADEAEVAPRARVQRSRLAFAIAVTLAALPVVVLDNLSATAEVSEAPIVVPAVAAASSSSEPSSSLTTASSTTDTTEAPTTTAAPTTTTTEAPASTTTQAPVAEVVTSQAPTTTSPPVTAPPTTAPPTTAPPTTVPPSPGIGDPNDIATWNALAECESGGNWSLSTGNGYYGGLQFSLATWQNVGGTGYPHQASSAEQIRRGKILQARAGWGQWPWCARQLGLL